MKRIFILLLLAFGVFIPASQATHIVGAEITYTAIDTLKFRVTFKAYRDCRGISMPSWPLVVRCGDSTMVENMGRFSTSTRKIKDITPVCKGSSSCGNSPNSGFSQLGVEEHEYSMVLDFTRTPLNKFVQAGCCTVRIETMQNARNGAITTGPSGALYTYAELNLCEAPTNSSPRILAPPRNFFCCNQPVYLSLGGADYVDGDSLTYEWAEPMSDYNKTSNFSGNYSYNRPVTAYYPGSFKWPYADPKATPPIGLFLDSSNGDLVYTPRKCDEVSVLTVAIKEWRKDTSGVYRHIGTVRREIQTVISNCQSNNVPYLNSSNQYTFNVDPCDSIGTIQLNFNDKDNSSGQARDTLRYTTFGSEHLKFDLWNKNSAMPSLLVSWTPEIFNTANDKITFVVEARDDACPMNGLSQNTITLNFGKNRKTARTKLSVTLDTNNSCSRDASEAIASSRTVIGTLYGFPDAPKIRYNSNETAIVDRCSNADTTRFTLYPHPFFTDSCFTDTVLISTTDTTHVIDFSTNWKHSSIGGHVYLDEYTNCWYPQNDTGVSNIRIEANPGNYVTTTDSRGDFLFTNMPEGKYNLSITSQFWKSTCAPSNVEVIKGKSTLRQDIGVKRDTSNVRLICGMSGGILDRRTQLVARLVNESKDTLKGVKLQMKLDSGVTIRKLGYWSKDSAQYYSTVGDCLPGGKLVRWLDVEYSADSFKVGDIATVEAKLLTNLVDSIDYWKADNTDKRKIKLRYSYDPNIKEIYQDSLITPFDSVLDYTIHFQNTGSAPAFYVEIRDTLLPELDEAQFELIESSHNPMNAILQDRKLYFIFPDIILADSASDEEASKGFVRFKIGLNNYDSLRQETLIKNSASIYFDKNEPIRTNEVINSVQSPVTLNKLANKKYCQGDTIHVSYATRYQPEPGQHFKVFLSDRNGSFQNRLEVLDTAFSEVQGVLPVRIPDTLSAGGHYRFEMEGAHALASTFQEDYSSSFGVIPVLYDTLTSYDSVLCEGELAQVSLKNKFGNVYRLFINEMAVDSNNTADWSQLDVEDGDYAFIELSDSGRCATYSDSVAFHFYTYPQAKFSIDSLFCGIKNVGVVNQSASKDSLAEYTLDWGDGNMTNGTLLDTASHLYQKSNVYDVSLRVESMKGCADSAVTSIAVGNAPSLVNNLQDAICTSDSIVLQANIVSSDSIVDEIWEVDGIAATPDEVLKYTSDDTHMIRLAVRTILGCSDTLEHVFKVNDIPKATISSTVLESCLDRNQFRLMHDPSVSPYTYAERKWIIEGVEYQQDTFIHTFSFAGVWPISLAIKDENGCFDSSSIEVEVFDYRSADFELSDTALCFVGNQFEATNFDTSRSANLSHRWSYDGREISGVNPVFEFDSPGEYEIVHFNEFNQRCKDTAAVTVSVWPHPEVSLLVDTVCALQPFYVYSQSDDEIKGNYQELWTFNGEEKSFQQLQDSVEFTAGSFGISTIYCEKVWRGCESRDSARFYARPKPRISIAVDSVCEGQTFEARALVKEGYASDYTEEWSYNSTSLNFSLEQDFVSFTAGNSGSARVIAVKDFKGCSASDTANFFIREIPEIDFLFSVRENDYVVLFDVTGEVYDYFWWDFGDGNSAFVKGELVQEYEYSERGEFLISLTGRNDATCANTVSKLVFVDGSDQYHIPNAYSPNFDGLNDEWSIVDNGNIASFHIRLIDKVGAVVYEGNDYKDILKGKNLIPGVYVYKMEIVHTNGETVEKVGTFHVLK
jgi:hypothetical protein